MSTNNKHHRAILQAIARRVMLERGLLPDFSAKAIAELDTIQAPASIGDGLARDQRELPWASIDNNDSRDLDQLTFAEAMTGDKARIMVAIADVDALVREGSAINEHARHNTASIYTAAKLFPMLPEKLSTDLTSLNLNEERIAVVIEMEIAADGSLEDSRVYRARVCNRAKLSYLGVAAWLDGKDTAPNEISSIPGMEENLRLQDKVAQSMKKLRHTHGALTLETIEAKPVFDGDEIQSLEIDEKNRAREIIEDFMIAANGVTARYLSAHKFPSMRRVVRVPKRWDRIMEIAAERKFNLPEIPDSKSLDEFLIIEKRTDPLEFPDLSLSIIKLLGAGEYAAESPDEIAPGHFGLAVKDYAHSTAPNRRYPDLIAQRLLKAALQNKSTPYRLDELEVLAAHCTKVENAVNKVERHVAKSAAALLLESRIGEQFDAIVTGASEKGTWVRLLAVPVEGKLVQGSDGLDVGKRVRVQLINTDIEKGFIDFKKVSPPENN